MTRGRNRKNPQYPDISLLEDVVSEKILQAMRRASEQLTSMKVRHALVGALAIGAHGYPRATRDVDFLVGEEAFQHFSGGLIAIASGIPIAVGDIPVDPISIAPGEDHLEAAIDSPAVSHGIPVAPLEAILYMKLKSRRQKDAVDVLELLKTGIDAAPARKYLQQHAPELVSKFDAIVERSIQELEE